MPFKRAARATVGDLEITELRMVFNIEKALTGTPNKLSLQVFNLNESHREIIDREGQKVQVYAGYEDTGAPLIFSGDIVNVVHKKTKTDWATTITSGDGISSLNQSVINKTLPAGTTVPQVYDILVKQLSGLEKGALDGVKTCLSGKRSFLRSLQLTGNVKDWLDQIARDCGFEYSVNDGIIETTPTGAPLSDVAPTPVNQGTGLIGSPEKTEIGVTVKNILLPEVKLGRTINLTPETKNINIGGQRTKAPDEIPQQGVYRINKIVHRGDTRSNQWETTIEAARF